MTKRKNTPKNKKPERRKTNLVLIATAAIIGLIIVGYAYFYIKNEILVLATRDNMTQYLKNKYNEDFVVKKPEYKHGGLGVKGIWISQVHPTNNSQLSFDINCSLTDTSDCSDTYLDSFFSKQEYDRLKLTMKNMGVTNYSTQLIIGYDALDSITKNTELVHVKQRYDPIYKLKVSIDKVNTKNEITDKIIAIVDEAYADGISRVEVEYEVTTVDGKNYKCDTNYELDPQLTSEIIEKCLKEV